MPGPLYHFGATATCPHGAPMTTISSNTRVLVSGQPVATMADASKIAGCPFQIPIPTGTKPQPCVNVKWIGPATRVKVNGQPALLQTSPAVCQSIELIPQGPPTITVNQTRVIGT